MCAFINWKCRAYIYVRVHGDLELVWICRIWRCCDVVGGRRNPVEVGDVSQEPVKFGIKAWIYSYTETRVLEGHRLCDLMLLLEIQSQVL
jgi:hypothetical protein